MSARKRHAAEAIIGMLREVGLAHANPCSPTRWRTRSITFTTANAAGLLGFSACGERL